MHWYVAKIVFQIICGNGNHTPQFDEQLRLIAATDEEEALAKARGIGWAEEVVFFNDRQELVQWKFIDVSERYRLQDLAHGAEVYSRIVETENAPAYITRVQLRAAYLEEASLEKTPPLTEPIEPVNF